MKKALLIILILAITKITFSEDNSSDLKTTVIVVKASQERLSQIPEKIRKTALVNGNLYYLTIDLPNIEKGVKPNYIIGLLKEPSKKITDGNITINPLFLNLIFELAEKSFDEKMKIELEKSEAKALFLFDQRVSNIYLPLKELMNDIIGIFEYENGKIVFKPNSDYSYFSKNGFMKLTPGIRKQLKKMVR